jgi:hypothetical protein
MNTSAKNISAVARPKNLGVHFSIAAMVGHLCTSKCVDLEARLDRFEARLDGDEELELLMYAFSEPGKARSARVRHWVDPVQGEWLERAGHLALQLQRERRERTRGEP